MKGAFAAIVALALVVWAPAARAQSSDVQTLSHEIELLRADIVDLQRYVYAGQGEPLAVVPDANSGNGADTQLRLQQLEERLRLLTGQVEDLDYQQRQINSRLDGIEASIAALGQAGMAPLASSTTTEPAADAGGTLTNEDLSVGESGDTAVDTGSGLPAGSEMDQYNYAFSLLRKADYDGAESAFNEFITLHPDSDLTGNAYYWLGETYYVRNAYQDAAIAFLKGYQRFPDGDKAPDNLLKLGMTLTRLNKNAEACATFNELKSKFPEAPQTVRDKAAQESAAAGCG